MAGFIKSVLIFTLAVTLMKSLVNNQSFRIYFKFFSGLVLILLMVSPLINFLSGDKSWYSRLEEEIFNFNLEGINDELKVADGMFEEIIKEECKENIKEQIKNLAQKRNVNIKDIDIGIDEKSSSIQIVSVDISITGNNGSEGKEDKAADGDIDIRVDVEAVNVMSGEEGKVGESEEASSNIGGIRKAEGKNIKMLKNDISSYFLIKEAAINIWEYPEDVGISKHFKSKYWIGAAYSLLNHVSGTTIARKPPSLTSAAQRIQEGTAISDSPEYPCASLINSSLS